MKCPKCGGKMTVYRTITVNGVVIRYRKCHSCGNTVKTIEE